MLRLLRRGSRPSGPQPARPAHRSALLPEALKRLESLGSPRVLDLGPTAAGNVSFFSERGIAVEAFDLFTWLQEYRRPTPVASAFGGQSPIECAMNRLFGSDAEDEAAAASFDLILMWDLFDYLGAEEIEQLVDRLSGRARTSTQIFSMVSYRSPIPHRPSSYRLVSTDELDVTCSATDGRKSPGHKEVSLLSLMSGYELVRGILLQNGKQELLFRYARSADAV